MNYTYYTYYIYGIIFESKSMNNGIPKLSNNRFLFENWNREFCTNFYDMYENKEFIKSKIIGWCESSKVFARKRNDDDSIAIMLDDNTWCHFPKFAIECLVGKDMMDFWNFEGYEETK